MFGLKHKRVRIVLATGFFFLPGTPGLAGEGGGKKPGVKIKGRVSTGFESKAFKKGESEWDVKLRFKTKRHHDTRAIAVLRGKSDDVDGVYVQDAWIDHKTGKKRRLQIGLNKKKLGTEYQFGEQERLTIRRSMLYQKLEVFAYVGREQSVRYVAKADPDKNEWGYEVSAGYAESLDGDLMLHLHRPLDQGSWNFGSWFLLQWDRINETRQTVWASVFSLWSREEPHHWEAELMAGQDPFDSELEKSYGDGKNVYYYGAKAQYGYRIDLGDERAIEPLGLTSWVVHDEEYPSYNTLQVLVGVRYHVADNFRVALNLDGVGTNSKIDTDDRSYDESSAAFEVQLFF